MFFMSDRDKGARVRTLLCTLNGRFASRLARLLGIGTVLCGAGMLASCHSGLTQGRTPVYVVIDSLQAASITKAGAVGTFSDVLRSDVLTHGSVFEDPGKVAMHIDARDISVAPTSNNNVTFTHYHVEFNRTDGHNTQGVDVPYAFDGAVTFTVTAGSGGGSTFTLVRVQAKLEPPLITLENSGGEIVISTIAKVTFYGKDNTGTDVAVTGYISVNFADWGDPPS
jgi:hypothetical protein